MTGQRRPLLSIVTPAYREEVNLPVLYERLKAALDPAGIDWEWIIIDDHSPDGTFTVASAIATADPRVGVVRFSRNFGSHAGIACGLRHAAGDSVAILAADLQDPPEILPEMLQRRQAGAQMVWAVRAARPGEKTSTLATARAYYWIMRHLVGLKEMPPAGADFLVLDRRVVEAITGFAERNTSIFALLSWIGFRQDYISYDKQPRIHGNSGWDFSKRLKLLIDSVTSFSYLPIRTISWIGMGIAILGFFYAIFIIVNALLGNPSEGWASLMVVVLVIGGLQMTMLGVLGEYIWRGMDEARRRPLYVVEARQGRVAVSGRSRRWCTEADGYSSAPLTRHRPKRASRRRACG